MTNNDLLVIKVGTSTLIDKNGLPNLQNFKNLVATIKELTSQNKKIVLVSSGAIGIAMKELNINKKPNELGKKQALAAIGQPKLMALYEKLFNEVNISTAQLLITRDVVNNIQQKENFINTIHYLLELNHLPIINENDSVSTNEIEFGDNDVLSAYVSTLIEASMLFILSDIDGLYTKNPYLHMDAKHLNIVKEISDEIRSYVTNSTSNHGTGGMITKIKAAEIVTKKGIMMAILNGKKPQNIIKILKKKPAGTLFIPNHD